MHPLTFLINTHFAVYSFHLKLLSIKTAMQARIWHILFSLWAFASFGQPAFDVKKLKNPKKYGPEIAASMKERLVYEYKPTAGKKAIWIPNDLRSSTFANPLPYLKIKDSILPYRVDIVYSRYPVIDSVYNEFYGLLCNRLLRTFELDADLNDADIVFTKVLQTHCISDQQVDSLFHGIVVWYNLPEKAKPIKPGTENSKEISVPQTGLIETRVYLENIKTSGALSDSVLAAISGKSQAEQLKIIKTYLEGQVQNTGTAVPLSQRSQQELFMYKRQVAEFLKNNPFADSVVWKVMERHPEWTNAIVVNDWTGSMYGYGAQIIHWHLNNYKVSGVKQVTLFNDGDRKSQWEKVLGETGGIYTSDANDVNKIINLFNLVRMNGSGGDRPENDIEALLSAMNSYPDAEEIILIADNYACVRDIELSEKINKPIKVIVCGYVPELGVNPHLAYLAKTSGGGLYTLKEDIEDLKVELGNRGEIKEHKDKRYKLLEMACSMPEGTELKVGKDAFRTYYNLDSATLEAPKVRKLNLAKQQLMNVPKSIAKMELLYELNLTGNQINKVPSKLYKLKNLSSLNLEDNQINALPKGFTKVRGLEYLNLKKNKLSTLSPFFESMYYTKQLIVAQNQLTNLTGINELKNLKVLDASENQITEIPVEFSQLKALQVLNLSGNQLKALPRNFTGLSKLEELNLSNNSLGSLPPYLYRLRKLKVLNLEGNPLSEKEIYRIKQELPNVSIYF